jgi:hypothetical protein
VIDDKIVSEDIIEEQFVCDLNACKGACCVEGDTGAPLNEDELPILDKIYLQIKDYLTPEGLAVLEKERYMWEAEDGAWKTPLIKNGPCAYITYDNGIAFCGIEKAYYDGVVDFKKPISCHLYPIRISKKKDFEAVNYERWNICKAACKNGKKLKVPVFKFLKEPIIRKYGEEFYTILEQYYQSK